MRHRRHPYTVAALTAAARGPRPADSPAGPPARARPPAQPAGRGRLPVRAPLPAGHQHLRRGAPAGCRDASARAITRSASPPVAATTNPHQSPGEPVWSPCPDRCRAPKRHFFVNDSELKVQLCPGAVTWKRMCHEGTELAPIAADRASRRPRRRRTAALPSGSGMAATSDEELLGRIGARLAAEAIRKGVDVVLGPTINLHRPPLGGRTSRLLRGDPSSPAASAARLRPGRAGGRRRRVPQALRRQRSEDRAVHRRADPGGRPGARELLPRAFEPGRRGRRLEVMAAYNAVGGTTMTENDLLRKSRWKIDGVVVSDWGATYNGRARAALEGGAGPHRRSGRGRGRVSRPRSTRRSAGSCGWPPGRALEGFPAGRGGRLRPVDAAPSTRRRAAACAPQQSGLLPLQAEQPAPGRVIGPGAEDARALGGG